MDLTPRAVDKFRASYEVNASGCWIWKGKPSAQGYGRFSFNGTTELAHRVSLTLHQGRIGDGLHVDHLCRVRMCVNPEHLEAVTSAVNVLRGQNWCADQSRKTHCLNGHELTGDNLYMRPATGRPGRECRECRRMRQRVA